MNGPVSPRRDILRDWTRTVDDSNVKEIFEADRSRNVLELRMDNIEHHCHRGRIEAQLLPDSHFVD